MSLTIDRIQDDGNRFIIRGNDGVYGQLKEIFDQIALGVSVTESEKGDANILYTENNRDIILRMLYEQTEGPSPEQLKSE